MPNEVITPLNKGLGKIDSATSLEDLAHRGWNLLREEISLPAAILYEEKLANNLRWMQQFIEAYGLKLAPHGKTTMAPQLFERQLRGGAWGITLASAQQTCAAYERGVRRVLMANQLVGRRNIETIARLLEDPAFDFFCLVDSAENVKQLSPFFANSAKPLQVLIEVGAEGGRTGIRDEIQLNDLLRALEQNRDQILLAGIELFEGVLEDESAIRALLKRAVALSHRLLEAKRFGREPFVLSGAGSSWYDVVADEFSKGGLGKSAEIVLRPGCYLTHDVGVYKTAQQKILQRNKIASEIHSGLVPALHLWAYVQSIPEKQKAIVALGKRDAAFDAGFPKPALHFRPGQAEPKPASADWEITKMMDQHAFMKISDQDDLRVGDMIGFDISHPCLTFDKWRYLCIVDRNYEVKEIVPTYF